MKLIHTLAVVALSTSLGACIIAPPRPPFTYTPAPVAVTYVDPTPVVQALPYVGFGWWLGRHWGGGHGHRHGHGH